MSLPVKEFRKSVNIWGSYGQEFSVLFFLRHSVYISVSIVQTVLSVFLYDYMSLLHCVIIDKHTYIHPFNGPLSRTTRVSRYQKGKTNLDFSEASDSEWQ